MTIITSTHRDKGVYSKDFRNGNGGGGRHTNENSSTFIKMKNGSIKHSRLNGVLGQNKLGA